MKIHEVPTWNLAFKLCTDYNRPIVVKLEGKIWRFHPSGWVDYLREAKSK